MSDFDSPCLDVLDVVSDESELQPAIRATAEPGRKRTILRALKTTAEPNHFEKRLARDSA